MVVSVPVRHLLLELWLVVPPWSWLAERALGWARRGARTGCWLQSSSAATSTRHRCWLSPPTS